jgi:phosphoglycolate phosphatase-like HAD superfamily hydrolase
VLNAFVEVVESDALLELDPLFEDTLSFLTAARASGWQIVVCTLRRRPDAAERQVDWLGLRAFIADLCVAAHGEEGPKAATLMRYAPSRTVMVGDTESDIASARRAGVPVYAVTTGVRGRAFLEGHGPDVIADSLTELLPLLKGTDE